MPGHVRGETDRATHRAGARTLSGAVSSYGAAVTRKLANAGAEGAPEDQLRAPLEALIADLAELAGLRRPIGNPEIKTALAAFLAPPSSAIGRVRRQFRRWNRGQDRFGAWPRASNRRRQDWAIAQEHAALAALAQRYSACCFHGSRARWRLRTSAIWEGQRTTCVPFDLPLENKTGTK